MVCESWNRYVICVVIHEHSKGSLRHFFIDWVALRGTERLIFIQLNGTNPPPPKKQFALAQQSSLFAQPILNRSKVNLVPVRWSNLDLDLLRTDPVLSLQSKAHSVFGPVMDQQITLRCKMIYTCKESPKLHWKYIYSLFSNIY